MSHLRHHSDIWLCGVQNHKSWRTFHGTHTLYIDTCLFAGCDTTHMTVVCVAACRYSIRIEGSSQSASVPMIQLAPDTDGSVLTGLSSCSCMRLSNPCLTVGSSRAILWWTSSSVPPEPHVQHELWQGHRAGYFLFERLCECCSSRWCVSPALDVVYLPFR